MERIFQDIEGEIEELSGQFITSLYSLNNSIDGGVCLLWLEAGTDKLWYRIFIDGWYCGVDRFDKCGIEEDVDEGYDIVDFTSSVKNLKIVEVRVYEPRLSNRSIVFSINFESSKLELICKNEDGDCILVQNI